MPKCIFLALWVYLTCFTATTADSVPVLIWSNDRSFEFPHPLAGHAISVDYFSQRYISPVLTHHGINVVLFIQDKLSLDDISLNAGIYDDSSGHGAVFDKLKSLMSSMSVAQLPSVETPSQALASLRDHFDTSSIHSLTAPYHVADLALDNSAANLLIVQLPATGADSTANRQTLRAIDDIVGSVTSYMKSLSSPFVALYTAMSSSHPAQQPQQHREFRIEHESRSGRQLLESAEDTATGGTGRLICNITGTLLLFVENITILTDGKPVPVAVDQMSCTAKDCNSNSTVCQVTLQANDVTFSLAAAKMSSSYWNVSHFEVTYTNTTMEQSVSAKAQLDPTFVTPTPLGFSYHCTSPAPVRPFNSTTRGVSVKFHNIQMQAFDIKKNNFGYYNDCEGFFTIPIWMGVVTMLAMLSIVLLGIAMLLSINTMDRYDDPKGKTITITAGD